MDKVAIFIDGGYLDKILRNEYRSFKLDLSKFPLILTGDKEILRTYYYYCMPYQSKTPSSDEKERYQNKQRFIQALAKISRFQLRQGRLQKNTNKKGEIIFEQKRIDVMMATDLIKLSSTGKINYAILITGDSDFVPAIKDAKEQGVIVQLYYSKQAFHDELLAACDERIEITSNLLEKAVLSKYSVNQLPTSEVRVFKPEISNLRGW